MGWVGQRLRGRGKMVGGFHSCNGRTGSISERVGLAGPCWFVAWWIGREECSDYGGLIFVGAVGW